MRKFLTHSAYWALVYGGAFALVFGLPRLANWLATQTGTAVSPKYAGCMIAASVAVLFFTSVVNGYRDPKFDTTVRAHLAELRQVAGMVLRWRTALVTVLAFFVWAAWSDIGVLHAAEATDRNAALMVLGLLFGLAGIAFMAGRDSRAKLIASLRAERDSALKEVDAAVAANSSLNAQMHAEAMMRRARAQPADGEMSRADLLAASHVFAAQA